MYLRNDESAVIKKNNSIKLCQENISVFDCVYQTSRDMLHSYAYLLTQCTTKAEDIVQDVFISIWLKKEDLPGIKDLQAYLYAITRNKVIDHMRRSQKE
jgi:RNA polymerase sigma factor (sigma-70 family)